MYVPEAFRAPDSSWFMELIRGHPLALLTTNGAGGSPHATHVPVIPRPGTRAADQPDLTGVTLFGHMNRSNPHWAELTSGTPAVVVFTGPHGYVSPSVYGYEPAAPTWDFTAVHVHGELHRIDGPEEALRVVTATVRALESGFGGGWAMTRSVDHFRRILPGVGAFRIPITRAEGMFKLSQEQEPEVRERVFQTFAQSEYGTHRQLAELMARMNESTETSCATKRRGRT